VVDGKAAHGLSVFSGEGMEAFLNLVRDKVDGALGLSAQPVLTRTRHRQGLEECAASLARFAEASEVELAAEDLRLAAQGLGRITGRVGVEDILDKIFSDFCIGK
jgi:tRNA modification GTPase